MEKLFERKKIMKISTLITRALGLIGMLTMLVCGSAFWFLLATDESGSQPHLIAKGGLIVGLMLASIYLVANDLTSRRR